MKSVSSARAVELRLLLFQQYSRLMHQYFTTSSETLCVLEDARSAGQDYKLL